MALARCILGKFLGVGCHCFPPPLDVPTFTTREASSSGRWNSSWARNIPTNYFGDISEKFFTTIVDITFTDFAKNDILYKNALDRLQTDGRMLDEFFLYDIRYI